MSFENEEHEYSIEENNEKPENHLNIDVKP